jgi:hypothetical protein
MDGRVRVATTALREAQARLDERLYEADEDVRRVCEALAGLSRKVLVHEGLGHPQRGFLRGLAAGTPVYLFSVGEDVRGLEAVGVGYANEALRSGARGTEAPPSGAGEFGSRSDLISSIDQVMERMKRRDVQAVVLFSDGRLVGGERTVPSAMSASTVPIYTISPVPSSPVLDVFIESVSLPESVFAGETLTVRVFLQGTGLEPAEADRPVEVYVEAEGERHVKPVVLGEEMGRVEFPLVLGEHGAQRLVIGVEGLEGEISYENNEVERWVKVLSERLRVALLAGTPGWDYQYLRNVLLRTPWVELRDGIMDRAGGGREAAPLTPQQLLQQDVVILNDLSVRAMSEAHWDALHKLVTERGGSAILVAGDAHLPREYVQHLLLSDLLPWRAGTTPQWRVWPGEQAVFRLVPSAEGASVEALRLGEGSAGLQRWQHLPPLYRYMPAPELRGNVRALLVERESGSAVLTEGRVGLGRVFFLGVNETWRWRQEVGERDQDRFWLQLIRHAAEPPYLARGSRVEEDDGTRGRRDETIALDVDRVRVEPGERVRVRAGVWDHAGAPSAEAEQVLRVVRIGAEGADLPAGVERMVRLGLVGPEGSGRYEGVLEGLPVGLYEVELIRGEGPGDGVQDSRGDGSMAHVLEAESEGNASPALGARGAGADGLREGRAVVRIMVAVSYEEEMRDLTGDAELLERIAEVSEGVFLEMDQLNQLPALLEERWEARSRRREYALWSSPWMFMLVLSCLGAEWALRKRVGLA